MPLRPGDKVREYEVLQFIGRGAHGTVLKVRGHPSDAVRSARGPSNNAATEASPSLLSPEGQRIFALKVLNCDPPEFHSNPRETQEREAAFAEASLLQRLRYPHIVGCEDVFWDADQSAVMLVLEFMDGGDLQTLIDTRRSEVEQGKALPFEPHFARRVLAAVGGALAYVHSMGILHRDVKPANVLLTRQSQRIKLADFGIAKILERTSNANTVVGTPYYLSPEIVMGQPYGEASDAWALGILLFEVAALRRPFEANNQLALVRRICEEAPSPIPEYVDYDIRSVLEGLLVKGVQERMQIQDALCVSEAVAALVVQAPTPAPSTPPLPQIDCEEADFLANLPSPTSADATSLTESRTSSALPVPSDSSSGNGGNQQHSTSLSSSCFGQNGSGPSGLETPTTTTGAAAAPPPGGGPASASPAGSSRAAVAGGAVSASSSFWKSWCGSEAAAAAREALGGEVDDPEELVAALAALEREREREREREQNSQLLDASEDLCEQPHSGEEALSALESELRLRIAALKDDAAAMLDDLLVEDDEENGSEADANDDSSHGSPSEEASSVSGVPLCSSRMSSVRGSATALEQALEVATSLGVDTDQSEERIARKSRMLSLRVKWGGVARFCMLPIIVGFDSLVAEVSRRFGLANGGQLPQLSWREAGDFFKLTSQADWEECLQRRGLVAQPGRLELCVEGDSPPPRPPQPRPRCHYHNSDVYGFGHMGHSPLSHHRPDLFTWRMTDRSQLWAASRRAGGGGVVGGGVAGGSSTSNNNSIATANANANANFCRAARNGTRSPPMGTLAGAGDIHLNMRPRSSARGLGFAVSGASSIDRRPSQTAEGRSSLAAGGGGGIVSGATSALVAALRSSEAGGPSAVSGGLGASLQSGGGGPNPASGNTTSGAGASAAGPSSSMVQAISCSGTSTFATAASSTMVGGIVGDMVNLATRENYGYLGSTSTKNRSSRPVVQVRGRQPPGLPERSSMTSPQGLAYAGGLVAGACASSSSSVGPVPVAVPTLEATGVGLSFGVSGSSGGGSGGAANGSGGNAGANAGPGGLSAAAGSSGAGGGSGGGGGSRGVASSSPWPSATGPGALLQVNGRSVPLQPA